ncbi:MAG: T9SS type A sorting domain-containing protein, partial [Saprospiraceae bacterium]
NETVWIPPLLAHPDKTKDAIFMAGGNVDGTTGSHMIKLEVINNGEIIPTQFDFNFGTSGGTISAMGMSPLDYNQLYVATTNGSIYKSNDGGENFDHVQFGIPGSNYLYGSCIKPSKIDVNTVYLSGSGYFNPAVYVSHDGGESYAPMNNGMPPTLVFCLAPNEDESLIFAATEAGPYVYITEDQQWYDLSGGNTPYQTYWSVEYLEDSQTARFGTYGRGIWDFELNKIITEVEETSKKELKFVISPNPFTDYIDIKITAAKNVTITVSDINGKIMKTTMQKSNENIRIDLQNIKSGTYFVTIFMDNIKETRKIIKI